MSYETEQRQFEEDVSNSLTPMPQKSTGYGQNFTVGVGQTIDENLSISEWIVRDTGGWSYSDRDQKLRDLREEGKITDQEWIAFVKPDNRGMMLPDYSSLADYANKKYGTEIKNNKTIDSEMREAIKQRKEYALNITERQTGMGSVGEFAGALTGYALEPAGIAAIPLESYFIGRAAYQLSQATTRLARATRVAGISAAANMATETAIQPIVFNWHEDIGVDMTWGDALFNIASVGLLSGVATGAAAGIRTKKGFKGEQLGSLMEQELVRSGDQIGVREVASILKQVRKAASEVSEDPEGDAFLRQTEYELESVTEDISARDHFEKMDATEKRISEGAPVARQEDDLDYVIDSAQLESAFESRMIDSQYMNEIKVLDLDDVDPQAGMFDEVIDLTPREKGMNAIEQIEAMDSRARNLDICLLGVKE